MAGDSKDVSNMPVRKEQCKTCVFRQECDGGIHLTPERHAEIRTNLMSGTNQICHGDDDKTICRGGRNYQLQIWSNIGIIAEPTDEALAEAMTAAGVIPNKHIHSKLKKKEGHG